VLDLFPVARLADTTINGRYPCSAYAAGRPFAVDFVLGACMLVRADDLRRIGTLDEGYFMYCEEIDWCRRFRAAGRSVVCVPEAVVVHHAGASTRQFRSAMFSALWRSRLRMYARHEPAPRRALLTAAVRWGLRARSLADRLAVASGRLDPAEGAERAAAYRAVLEPAP
jgi:GT2 family glycosyltransferase